MVRRLWRRLTLVAGVVIGALVASTGVAAAGAVPEGFYWVRNGETGNCLELSSHTWVLQAACNGYESNQSWRLVEQPGGYYYLVFEGDYSDVCLSGSLGKHGEGWPASLEKCDQTKVDQQWLLLGGIDAVAFVSKSTNKYLMVNPTDAYARLYTDPTVVWPGSYAGVWCFWKQRDGGSPPRCRR